MERAIERPNQAILPPLILGHRASLTADDQEHVTTWALKTHLMAQFRHHPFRPAPSEQLGWLYEQKTPFPNGRAWLAAFDGHLLHRACGRTHAFQLVAPSLAEDAPGHVLNAEMMTLCIGQLVLQTFKWSGSVDAFDVALSDETAQFVLPLWPSESRTLLWPPAVGLDTFESLSNFADAFIKTGPPPETAT